MDPARSAPFKHGRSNREWPPVFGTVCQPKGLSGLVRRWRRRSECSHGAPLGRQLAVAVAPPPKDRLSVRGGVTGAMRGGAAGAAMPPAPAPAPAPNGDASRKLAQQNRIRAMGLRRLD